ncbi:hypothetical protein M8J75_011851 [Diaphorina citri]|nr:hypothetical protein M8J75_011851 [Diaphorina citri]
MLEPELCYCHKHKRCPTALTIEILKPISRCNGTSWGNMHEDNNMYEDKQVLTLATNIPGNCLLTYAVENCASTTVGNCALETNAGNGIVATKTKHPDTPHKKNYWKCLNCDLVHSFILPDCNSSHTFCGSESLTVFQYLLDYLCRWKNNFTLKVPPQLLNLITPEGLADRGTRTENRNVIELTISKSNQRENECYQTCQVDHTELGHQETDCVSEEDMSCENDAKDNMEIADIKSCTESSADIIRFVHNLGKQHNITGKMVFTDPKCNKKYAITISNTNGLLAVLSKCDNTVMDDVTGNDPANKERGFEYSGKKTGVQKTGACDLIKRLCSDLKNNLYSDSSNTSCDPKTKDSTESCKKQEEVLKHFSCSTRGTFDFLKQLRFFRKRHKLPFTSNDCESPNPGGRGSTQNIPTCVRGLSELWKSLSNRIQSTDHKEYKVVADGVEIEKPCEIKLNCDSHDNSMDSGEKIIIDHGAGDTTLGITPVNIQYNSNNRVKNGKRLTILEKSCGCKNSGGPNVKSPRGNETKASYQQTVKTGKQKELEISCGRNSTEASTSETISTTDSNQDTSPMSSIPEQNDQPEEESSGAIEMTKCLIPAIQCKHGTNIIGLDIEGIKMHLKNNHPNDKIMIGPPHGTELSQRDKIEEYLNNFPRMTNKQIGNIISDGNMRTGHSLLCIPLHSDTYSDLIRNEFHLNDATLHTTCIQNKMKMTKSGTKNPIDKNVKSDHRRPVKPCKPCHKPDERNVKPPSPCNNKHERTPCFIPVDKPNNKRDKANKRTHESNKRTQKKSCNGPRPNPSSKENNSKTREHKRCLILPPDWENRLGNSWSLKNVQNPEIPCREENPCRTDPCKNIPKPGSRPNKSNRKTNPCVPHQTNNQQPNNIDEEAEREARRNEILKYCTMREASDRTTGSRSRWGGHGTNQHEQNRQHQECQENQKQQGNTPQKQGCQDNKEVLRKSNIVKSIKINSNEELLRKSNVIKNINSNKEILRKSNVVKSIKINSNEELLRKSNVVKSINSNKEILRKSNVVKIIKINSYKEILRKRNVVKSINSNKEILLKSNVVKSINSNEELLHKSNVVKIIKINSYKEILRKRNVVKSIKINSNEELLHKSNFVKIIKINSYKEILRKSNVVKSINSKKEILRKSNVVKSIKIKSNEELLHKSNVIKSINSNKEILRKSNVVKIIKINSYKEILHKRNVVKSIKIKSYKEILLKSNVVKSVKINSNEELLRKSNVVKSINSNKELLRKSNVVKSIKINSKEILRKSNTIKSIKINSNKEILRKSNNVKSINSRTSVNSRSNRVKIKDNVKSEYQQAPYSKMNLNNEKFKFVVCRRCVDSEQIHTLPAKLKEIRNSIAAQNRSVPQDNNCVICEDRSELCDIPSGESEREIDNYEYCGNSNQFDDRKDDLCDRYFDGNDGTIPQQYCRNQFIEELEIDSQGCNRAPINECYNLAPMDQNFCIHSDNSNSPVVDCFCQETGTGGRGDFDVMNYNIRYKYDVFTEKCVKREVRSGCDSFTSISNSVLLVSFPNSADLNMLPLYILLTLAGSLTLARSANPDPPRSTSPRRGLSATQDCNGPVAFSGTGGVQHPSRLVAYRRTLAEAGVGWNQETGEFTVHCPGLYQMTFAGLTEPGAKLVLKKHSSSDNSTAWSPVISTPKGGGSNLVLLDLAVGDQLGVWTEGSGALLTTQDAEIHVTSFSGFRISKNAKNELKS